VVTAAGSLFVVGGKDGRNGDLILLARFLEVCGGSAARVLVITTASSEPDRQDQEYAEAFSKLGARKVSIVHPARRTDADDPALLSELDRAAGVYFSGGGQRKLVATLGGSKFHARLRARHRKGLHVGGTSAGAAALSKVMIAGGHELSNGFGLLPGVIVDQHFQQRQRMGRLFAAVMRHPRLLGFGVDEATAAEIDPSGRVSVLGAGALTVVDGSELVRGSPGAPMSFAGLRLHSLGQGWGYNLRTREAKKSPPAGRVARRRAKSS
jgi:cyanophycinase